MSWGEHDPRSPPVVSLAPGRGRLTISLQHNNNNNSSGPEGICNTNTKEVVEHNTDKTK